MPHRARRDPTPTRRDGAGRATSAAASSSGPLEDADVNVVAVRGRVGSDPPERRALPSGDEVVGLTLVVRRPDGGTDALPIRVGPAPGPGGRRRPGQRTRRELAATERLRPGDTVHIEGRLVRRWWRAGERRVSRIEVDGVPVTRAVSGGPDG
jgi:single-strand DNA-binding protein